MLAVEAFEGTDKAIRRAGELGKGKVVVVKVSKPDQDMRFDVPCIGTRTVDALVAADARVLAVEAGCTLLIDRKDLIQQLDRAKIALVGFAAD